ncbi:MAG: helix-turn-helix domain-containing protein [Deltaproteobacteria bacterium]
MARSIPSGRLERLIEVATETFIAEGYRRTQMADVAEALGIAKGTLYGYVESKAALFDAAIRYADGHEPLPGTAELPIKTPAPGDTVKRLENRIAAEAADLRLVQVAAAEPARDVTSELREVLVDLYRRANRNRFAIKLADRCASDHPDLAVVWFGRGRWAQHELLVHYIRSRIAAGRLRRVPSVPVAARTALETVAFWAVHRYWDPSPQSIEEDAVEEAVVDLLVHSLVQES